MTLSRRGFLGGLLAVVSAPAIVRVENLMALPKPPVITPIIPPVIFQDRLFWVDAESQVVQYSENSFLAINQITREAVRLFKNSNAFIEKVNREYDREFAAENIKIGSQLRMRLPNDFVLAGSPTHSIE